LSAENKSAKGEVPREVASKFARRFVKTTSARGLEPEKCNAFCYRIARNNIEKLCIFAKEKNKGCPQVNKRYDALGGV